MILQPVQGRLQVIVDLTAAKFNHSKASPFLSFRTNHLRHASELISMLFHPLEYVDQVYKNSSPIEGYAQLMFIG